MVVRLFVPPGEGQDNLIPRRPDAIGANATLQYTVLASSGLAAAYTSFAANYQRRVTLQRPISRRALFIRSSARYGIWVGALGAAANWYYYSAFATVAAAKVVQDVTPWKLYERTKEYTVDDGFLAGAALGAAVSISTLLMRRPVIPRWTRLLGITHIGACAGILGAHGYLQYTGERQKAYECLAALTTRKNLELWAIFWDKELMAQFNPIIQLYIRNNGIWHASLLPETAFQGSHEYNLPVVGHPDAAPVQEPTPTPTLLEELRPYYIRPPDYAEDLRTTNVPAYLLEISRLEQEKAGLLAEAELLLSVNAANQYKYCHNTAMSDEERRTHLQHIFVIDITCTRLQRFANVIDEKLLKLRLALQHQALWTGSKEEKDNMANWMPVLVHGTHVDTVKPDAAIKELEELHSVVSEEVKRFTEWSNDVRFEHARRERWRSDAEDGIVLLRAVDQAVYALGKHRQRVLEVEEKNERRHQRVCVAGEQGCDGVVEQDGTSAGASAVGKGGQTPPDGGIGPKGS